MFEDNLRELREISGLSQTELANRVGVTRGAIAQYEMGSTVPNVKVGIKLAKLFGVSCEELVYGSITKSERTV